MKSTTDMTVFINHTTKRFWMAGHTQFEMSAGFIKHALRAKISADQIDRKCHVRHRKDTKNLD
jgi:hypothetical protein